MTRRERLWATLRGEPVDRPPVSLYEIGGFTVDPADPDPFNIYNDPSWLPLLKMAEEETDLIRMTSPARTPSPGNPRAEFFQTETWQEGDSRFTRTTVTVAGRTLTRTVRRDAAMDTSWCVEHLLKDTDDLRAYLQLPDEVFDIEIDVTPMIQAEESLGDKGVVLVDTGDPLCMAADLFKMEDYTVIAFTEPDLFHALLEKLARSIHSVTQRTAEAFPGRLWRIFGPEYASEPYLPPRLFKEYVVRYDQPMVDAIHATGGYVRMHSHGRLKHIMPHIAAMGVDGLDPVEPPPQGDVELDWMRREFGRDLVLFGNLEVSDIENMEPAAFESVVRQSLADGTSGEGRGFVLMPSASPYGRTITARTRTNYETIVRLATQA